MATEIATFAAGCFWSVEETFRNLAGVTNTCVGYTGGTAENPSYEQVCGGGTGHAEAVRVEFNNEHVGYDELLDVFWQVHDPTQKDRQGPDVGSQYRSAIFYHTPEQEAAARKAIEELTESGSNQTPIVTQVVPAGPFYQAEEYHQQYVAKKRPRIGQ